MSFSPEAFSPCFLVYPLTTKLKKSKKWNLYRHSWSCSNYRAMGLLLCITDYSQWSCGWSVSIPLLQRGKQELKVLPVIPPVTPAFRGKQLRGVLEPHSLGPVGTLTSLPMRWPRHRAPKPERGDLDLRSFLSPHTKRRLHFHIAEFQTPEGWTLLARVLWLYKSGQAHQVKVWFLWQHLGAC